MPFKCSECEDSGYYWDTWNPCPSCELGEKEKYRQNKKLVKYHRRMAYKISKEIKEYEEQQGTHTK